MVWYGRVWDDKKDDWAHELDDAPVSPTRAPAPPAPPPPVTALDLYGTEVSCVEGHSHHLGGDSGRGWCHRCGFRWLRLHTISGEGWGTVVTGTGAEVLAVGTAITTLKAGDRVGVGA